MEVFSPPYLFNGPRPTIFSAPDRLQWNQNFTVSCSNPADISHAVLIRCGSATHGFDVDQRLVELQVDSRTKTNVVFKPLPNRNILPIGHYMLFALNASGVPSRAVIVRCGG
jgi:galactose oxidase